MYSVKLIETHFWIGTVGIVLYIASMWIAGVMEGLYWRDLRPDGTLTYSFIEVVRSLAPYYVVRFLGGVLYLTGMIIMAYNVFKTIAQGKAVDAPIQTVAQAQHQ